VSLQEGTGQAVSVCHYRTEQDRLSLCVTAVQNRTGCLCVSLQDGTGQVVSVCHYRTEQDRSLCHCRTEQDSLSLCHCSRSDTALHAAPPAAVAPVGTKQEDDWLGPRVREDRNVIPPPGIDPRLVGRPERILVTTQTVNVALWEK
jgi:hypothetical protein